VDYVYWKNKDFEKVNVELLLAQAALESGWGDSRFAKVGKNLFGIRTYDLQDPHMLPSNTPKKWGVRVYEHECYSVEHYIKILNNGTSFEDYRKLREEGIDDPFKLVETLGAYASDKNYFPKIKSIIKTIRVEYNIK
jgi:Bax protein